MRAVEYITIGDEELCLRQTGQRERVLLPMFPPRLPLLRLLLQLPLVFTAQLVLLIQRWRNGASTLTCTLFCSERHCRSRQKASDFPHHCGAYYVSSTKDVSLSEEAGRVPTLRASGTSDATL